MDEVREYILEILEGGMKEEYKLDEVATRLAEFIDVIFEDMMEMKLQLRDLNAEVL